MLSERRRAFDQIVEQVQACRLCHRMCGSVRVLSWANGSPDATIMVVGEAPGRLGADRTAIPFHGDKAGDNFERLIGLAGLSRANLFVSNAVLCNPRDERGNNSTPLASEISNCARHLRAQIDVVQPAMVLTLGAVALEATRHVEPHALTLKESVRTAHKWNGRLLLPLYHPGARAMIHRSFANQTADYYFVGETFRRLHHSRRPQSTASRGEEAEWRIVRCLLQNCGAVSNFRLHKLMYLIELEAQKALGGRPTNFLYLRQKDGPYCVELGSRWYNRFSGQITVKKIEDRLIFAWQEDGLFECPEGQRVDPSLERVVAAVVASTSNCSDAQLKTRAYLTQPMRKVLKAEKAGMKMLNSPLLARAV